MEALNQNRRSHRQQAARSVGEDSGQPHMFKLQKIGDQGVIGILSLPEKIVAPIQITDPTDPLVGSFYFMPGFDDPFGPVILP